MAIFFWERHQGSGFVPVGWMWFLAYSTSFSACTLAENIRAACLIKVEKQ